MREDWNTKMSFEKTSQTLLKLVSSLLIRLGIRCTNRKRECKGVEDCQLLGVRNREEKTTEVVNSLGRTVIKMLAYLDLASGLVMKW